MDDTALLSHVFLDDIVKFVNTIHFQKCNADQVKHDIVQTILKKTEPLLRKFVILEIHLNKDKCSSIFSENTDFLKSQIEQKYPFLVNVFLLKCTQICTHINLFFQRFIQDYSEIKQSLHENRDFEITNLNICLGDDHFNSQSVLSLTTNEQVEIFYKPKNLTAEIIFEKTIRILGFDELYDCVPAFIYKKNYAWQQGILASNSEAPSASFYEKIGKLLSVFYLFRTCDIHFENMLVQNNCPYFIDLETLVQPAFSDAEFYKYNLMHTMVLPTISFSNGKEKGIDLSALGYWSDQTFPEPMEEIVNRGSLDVKMAKVKKTLKEAANKEIPTPFFKGEDYEAVARGFSQGLQCIKGQGLRIIECLKQYADEPMRVLLRPTHTYKITLQNSFHPHVMKNAQDFKTYLLKIKKSSYLRDVSEDILDFEIAQLTNLCVPIFYTTIASHRLFSHDDFQCKNYFKYSALECVEKNLKSIDGHDEKLQKYIIEAAFKTHSHFVSKAQPKLEKKLLSFHKFTNEESQPFDNFIHSLYEKIRPTFKVKDNFFDAVGCVLLNGTDWTVISLKADFYAGTSGLLLMLALVGKYLKNAEILKEANVCYEHVLEEIQKPSFLKVDVGIGGVANILSTSTFISSVLNRNNTISQAILSNINNFLNDKRFDFINGQAGLIKSLCEFDGVDKNLLEKACENLKRAFNADSYWWNTPSFPHPTLGLSHGYSGYALAFGLAGKKLKKQEYLDFSKELLKREDSYFVTQENKPYWPDLRVSQTAVAEAWCHGSGGILLARAKLFKVTNDKDYLVNIEAAIINVENKLSTHFNDKDTLHDISLCHGLLGLVESLRFAADIPYLKPKISFQYEESYRFIQGLIETNRYKLGVPVEVNSPHFMTGISGVIYAYVKYEWPDLVPDILV